MTEYGVFANTVAIAGCLIAATAAISLAWMKRSKWQPPEEEVPKGVARVAALVSAVVIAILFVFSRSFGMTNLAIAAGIGAFFAVICLAVTIFVNYSRSFRAGKASDSKRVLGGFRLTAEAENIKRQWHHGESKLFEDAQYDKDLVWTRESQAIVLVLSAVSFIMLIAVGTSTLAIAANLISLAVNS